MDHLSNTQTLLQHLNIHIYCTYVVGIFHYNMVALACGSECNTPLGGPRNQWQQLASQKAFLARTCEQLYTRFGYSEQMLRYWVGTIWIYDSLCEYAYYVLEDRFNTAVQDLLDYD